MGPLKARGQECVTDGGLPAVMVPEVNRGFWAGLARGEFLIDAAALAGTHRWRALKWVRGAGGVRPRRGRDLKGPVCDLR